MIGSGTIASHVISGSLDYGAASGVVGFIDDILTREQMLIQPWAWLEFYEITTVGFGVLRYVDSQDPDTRGSIDALFPFNGEEYSARKITRGALKVADGVSQFTVEIEDVNRELILALDEGDGLNLQTVTLHRIPYDLALTKPHKARTDVFRVRVSVAYLGPDRATLSIGLPSLADFTVPHRTVTRNRCSNDYNRRFESDGHCSYPSDHFEEGTKQILGSHPAVLPTPSIYPAAPTERRFGWSTINADKARTWVSSNWPIETVEVGGGKLWTSCVGDHDDLRWETGDQNGLFMYKDISGDFDVSSRVRSFTTRANYLQGFLVQSPTATDDWIFWGQSEAASVAKMRARQSLAGPPVDTDFDLTTGDEYIRIARLGATFTVYTRLSAAVPWVSKKSLIWSGSLEPMRVGLLVASDTVDAVNPLNCSFESFIFSAGGFVDCNRSRADCNERDNFHQFNAYPSLPRNRVRG